MLGLLDWSVVALYIIGTLFIGFIFHKKASQGLDDYFLGGRNMPWWVLGASGMSSNVDVAGTMVIASLIYALGTKGFLIEIRGGVVLILVFFMVFMGKWTRRAQVMTSAEWMILRFGQGREGKTARLMSAIASLVVNIWIISYFAVGGGKFFSTFLGVSEQTASIAMILVTMLYASASGFYGVVWTDVFQGGLILVGILYLVVKAAMLGALPETFSVSVPAGHGNFQSMIVSFTEWSSAFPKMVQDLPGDYSAYNLFGITVFFYFIKTSIEGFGGAGGYMSQRYFAAKSDREAGLLSLFWIFLLSFRWPLVTAIAVLALHYSIGVSPITDPEMALPIVISHYAPVGMRGLLVACFMAAAMSTFVSIINASAAYWVKDIYQAFLRPAASQKELVWQSKLSSIIIVVLGVLFSFPVVNINDIWGWLTTAFGTGLFIPILLRWYWWRFNGYGFAVGTLFGMLAAIFARFGGVALPEYMGFLLPGSISLLGCILGTYFTPATPMATLKGFYENTRPFGFWGPILAEYSKDKQTKLQEEHRNDLISTAIAVPWMLTMCMAGMLLVMRRWDHFFIIGGTFVALSILLYFLWFKKLNQFDRD